MWSWVITTILLTAMLLVDPATFCQLLTCKHTRVMLIMLKMSRCFMSRNKFYINKTWCIKRGPFYLYELLYDIYNI